jgi:hypothetical protein
MCFGSGGHQDNVVKELYDYCEWIGKNGTDACKYVFLIDTDKNIIQKLKERYNNSMMLFVNTNEFIEYIKKLA